MFNRIQKRKGRKESEKKVPGKRWRKVKKQRRNKNIFQTGSL